MNIFYLHDTPVTCAQYHTDKHVVKMIIEYAQLLSTAHRLVDGDEGLVLYKATHKNHPSAKYVRMTTGNYYFVYELFIALCDEYTHRYGKVHATDSRLRHALKDAPIQLPIGAMTRVPQAMPDAFKVPNSMVAYRNYYRKDKQHLHKWTKRKVPSFIGE
jgi:hypothetical protein